MKRTFEKRNTSSFEEVYVPFKERIPIGTSTFSINVPVIYSDRQFFFSSLVLVPDFYSLAALIEGLDDPEIFNTLIDYEIRLRTNFLDRPNYFPEEFVTAPTVRTTWELAKAINDFFEAHKPAPSTRLGCFLDWQDIRFNGDVESWEEWMARFALSYYGEPLDPAKHFNALPLTARTVVGVNNYLFPTILSDEDREHLRFRIVVAPNLDILFSTDKALLNLGFSEDQIGERSARKKIVWRNEDNNSFQFFQAENDFDNILNKSTVFKVGLRVANNMYLSDSMIVSIKKGDSIKNEKYLDMFKKALDSLAYESNLKLDLSYNKAEKTFSFTFPEDRAIGSSTLFLPADLSERLGFNSVTEINNTNKKGQPVTDEIDVEKTLANARALGYETGVVIVTNANVPANTTAGMSEQFMCSLYPTSTGTFEIPILESCFKPPSTSLPNFYSMANATVPTTFKLSRYTDNDTLVHLDWKNNAFVSGLLRGSKPL